jgi:hypothetical protein
MLKRRDGDIEMSGYSNERNNYNSWCWRYSTYGDDDTLWFHIVLVKFEKQANFAILFEVSWKLYTVYTVGPVL